MGIYSIQHKICLRLYGLKNKAPQSKAYYTFGRLRIYGWFKARNGATTHDMMFSQL